MRRVYFLSYLEWNGRMNIGRCHSFETDLDATARQIAAEHLATRSGRTSFARLRCQTERPVRL